MTATLMKKRAMDVCVGLFVLSAVLYFGHRGLQGESGVFVNMAAAKEIDALSAEHAALQAERRRLENLTKRLSEGYLDLDLLDERARDMLGYVGDREVVVR